MRKEKFGKRNEKKSCFDCLHCKVSARSSIGNFLCFCAKAKQKVCHKEPYWMNKKLCKHFFDMSA
jgi:hypothetical protein